MRLLIGLGNPGKKYDETRHNVGFLVLDELAKRHAISFREKRSLECALGEGSIHGQEVLLCKPETFMNASGRCVHRLVAKHTIKAEKILVVYDDADLSFGSVRFRSGGSSGGHRGMTSILEQFPHGTNIARVRVGIGRPSDPDIPLDSYVLQQWDHEQQKQLPALLEKAVEEIVKQV